ncbi:hypothetical protein LguiA_028948 [Lonicera macranthoides]
MLLNRQSSASKKSSPAPAPAKEQQRKKENRKKKKKQSPRSPLLDLNGTTISRNNSSNSSSISSSMSIEAPKGCLRFFSSSSSSSKPSPSLLQNRPKISLPKTNASNPSPSRSTHSRMKENYHLHKPSSQKQPKNPLCLYQWQSGKKPTSRTSLKPKPSLDLKQQGQFGEPTDQLLNLPNNLSSTSISGSSSSTHNHHFVDNLTPVGKLVCGFGLDCVIDDNIHHAKQNSSATTSNATTSSNKTPPVQASVSPEIQCGSSSLQVSATTTTPTCYGAGYVVSGVSDRRKCRPRGILTVGSGIDSSGSSKVDAFDTCTNSSDGDDIVRRVLKTSRRTSLIPLPAEASMSWLLSPCHENDEDQKSDSANGLHQFQKLVSPATFDLPSSPSSLCNNGNFSGTGNKDSTFSTTTSSSRKTTRITLLSPRTPPEFQDEKGNSPFSIDSLGNGNVIQTPKTDSSSERRIGQSWLSEDVHYNKSHFDYELDSGADVLGKTSLSPKFHKSQWDPLGLSFKFAKLNRTSWTSNSSVEQSQMRISWREGLASRIFEMDEYDCCRCLSDEENDHLETNLGRELNVDVKDDDGYLNNDGLKSPEFLEDEPKVDEEGKGKVSSIERPSSCAESICTDGDDILLLNLVELDMNKCEYF